MIIPVAVRHPEIENCRSAVMVRQGLELRRVLELRQFAFSSFSSRPPVGGFFLGWIS